MSRNDPLELHPGVLSDEPLCEFGGFGAVERLGGRAVLPWRGAWLSAREAGIEAPSEATEIEDGRFGQCLVHLQKGRAANEYDLAEAWRLLAPGGRLLLVGPNALGIVSAVKRLARVLDQPARIVANRAHARVALFSRSAGEGPLPPEPTRLTLPALRNGDAPTLRAEAGVFSGRKLDAGSATLLARLPLEKPAASILDLGCGIGVFGLFALLLWPRARALLLDADARAVRSARQNALALGVADRCEVAWWDAQREPCPKRGFDLALSNPPFHRGHGIDLSIAHALFERLGQALSRGGRAWLAANRPLPYEKGHARRSRLRALGGASAYKLLALENRIVRGGRGGP